MQDKQWKDIDYDRDRPEHMKKYPDRDYSVNRAERRKRERSYNATRATKQKRKARKGLIH